MVCLDILIFVDELDIGPVCGLFNVWYTPGEWPVELWTPVAVELVSMFFYTSTRCKELM